MHSAEQGLCRACIRRPDPGCWQLRGFVDGRPRYAHQKPARRAVACGSTQGAAVTVGVATCGLKAGSAMETGSEKVRSMSGTWHRRWAPGQ
jgi:hypothetical protein